MYRALAQAMIGFQDAHTECRKEVVDFILVDVNWSTYSIHIKAQESDYVRKRKEAKEDEKEPGSGEGNEANGDASLKNLYRNYMMRNRSYGTFMELNAASDLFEFNFIVFRQLGLLEGSTTGRKNYFYNILSFKDTFTHATTHHFLYSGHGPHGGHFDYLEPTSPDPDVEPILPFRIESGYYEITEIDDFCVRIKRFLEGIPGSQGGSRGEQNSGEGDTTTTIPVKNLE